jgi:hypothetical protein
VLIGRALILANLAPTTSKSTATKNAVIIA